MGTILEIVVGTYVLFLWLILLIILWFKNSKEKVREIEKTWGIYDVYKGKRTATTLLVLIIGIGIGRWEEEIISFLVKLIQDIISDFTG